MVADQLDYVVGVDTHRDEHTLAVVEARSGALVAQRTVSSMVSRSPQGERRLRGKDDELDASGLPAALTSEPLPLPRSGAQREALRLLLLARRSAVDVRREALVQLRSSARSSRTSAHSRRSCTRSRASARSSRRSCSSPGHIPAASAPRPPLPASPASHRSPPPAAKPSATGSAAAATANSTAPSTRSSCTAVSTTRPPRTTSPDAPPTARVAARPPGCSSATSPVVSTGCWRTGSRCWLDRS